MMASGPIRIRTGGRLRHRAGAVLLETLLSLAIFVAVAMLTLGITSSAIDAIGRDRLQSVATDIARSRFAELGAGTLSMAELRDPGTALRSVGSIEWADLQRVDDIEWQLRATSLRSAHADHNLVVVTVRAIRNRNVLAEASVRGLLRLSEEDSEDYEDDEMLEGLPEDDASSAMFGGPSP